VAQLGNRPRTGREETGSLSIADGKGKKGLAWLWALVALAVLALIAAATLFLLARNAWDEGDKSGIDLTNDPSRSGEATDDAASDERSSDDDGSSTADTDGSAGTGSGATTPTTAGAGGPGTGGAAADASLISGGQALLPVPAGGLAAYSGQAAEATSVAVESVISDEGFWVGDSADQRVFVRLVTGGAESPVQIERGRRVSFSGTVTPNPADLSTLGITAEEGADLLMQQGQYIDVQLGDIRQS
jgi:hypothetical protein